MTARRLIPAPTLGLMLGLTLTVTAFLSPATSGAGEDVRSLPGYVDLDWIHIPPNASTIQDITLDPVLAGLAAGQPGGVPDEALRQALAMVKSVRVKAFSLAEGQESSGVAADMKTLQERLEKGKWQRLVYAKEGEETVTISTLYEGGLMVGLILLTYEPGDSAAFVNVVGNLDLPTLMKLAGQMRGEQLESFIHGIDGAGKTPDGGTEADGAAH